MKTNSNYDVIIIGAGAAGLSAALTLGRSLRSTLVLDTGTPRNRFAAGIHGVLGNDGTAPEDFLARGRSEVAGYGVQFGTAAAATVVATDAGITVTDTQGRRHAARRLVAATGISDELPPLPGLAAGWGTDVLHCPYCHGWEVRGQRLGILATSPMALHQAQLIRQWSDDVVLFSAGAGPIDDALATTLASRDVVIDNRQVTGILRNDAGALTGVRMVDGGQRNLDALFTAGELHPQDAYLDGLGLTREQTPCGSFIAAGPTGKTSHPRIWAAGNLVAPMANVPMSMSAGTMAGSMVNMDLVTEDFNHAAQQVHAA
ncbi:NAD(P)/FAD-dependent oxidoreductase [Arthrobacter rhombi]|uniref:NAD(P)/FAD-dependent oxidoreductase n=1 Tax=Arthrobacter rhombi TaxID=71253 RepID=UPI003F918961